MSTYLIPYIVQVLQRRQSYKHEDVFSCSCFLSSQKRQKTVAKCFLAHHWKTVQTLQSDIPESFVSYHINLFPHLKRANYVKHHGFVVRIKWSNHHKMLSMSWFIALHLYFSYRLYPQNIQIMLIINRGCYNKTDWVSIIDVSYKTYVESIEAV